MTVSEYIAYSRAVVVLDESWIKLSELSSETYVGEAYLGIKNLMSKINELTKDFETKHNVGPISEGGIQLRDCIDYDKINKVRKGM